ncbi:hypothetical protein HN51_012364, partial [Arachis hypogaea]
DSVQVEEIEPSQAQINALPKDWRTSKDHPLDNVIGDVSKGISTPCTPPSIHMHMPPCPFPFISPILGTPLTDVIMEKLKSLVGKSVRTIVKKTNARHKKELPGKGSVSVGKKLYSPKSS